MDVTTVFGEESGHVSNYEMMTGESSSTTGGIMESNDAMYDYYISASPFTEYIPELPHVYNNIIGPIQPTAAGNVGSIANVTPLHTQVAFHSQIPQCFPILDFDASSQTPSSCAAGITAAVSTGAASVKDDISCQNTTNNTSLFYPHAALLPKPQVYAHISAVMDEVSSNMAFTDVEIVVKTNDGVTPNADKQNWIKFKAHKCVLASHSSYLRQLMLDHEQSDFSTTPLTLVVLITNHCCVNLPAHPCSSSEDGVSPSSSPTIEVAMEAILNFLYTGKLIIKDPIERLQRKKHDCCSSLEVESESSFVLGPIFDLCRVLGITSLMARIDEYHESLTTTTTNGTIEMQSINYPPSNFTLDDEMEMMLMSAGTPFDSSASNTDKPTHHQSECEGGGAFIHQDAYYHTSSATANASHYSLTTPTRQNPEVPSNNNAQVPLAAAFPSETLPACPSHSTSYFDEVSLSKELDYDTKKRLCTICFETFATQSSLKRHMNNVHRQLKSDSITPLYKCVYCEKPFSDKSSMARHIKSKHDHHVSSSSSKDVIRCDICPLGASTFTRLSSLRLHVSKFHNEVKHEVFLRIEEKYGQKGGNGAERNATVCHLCGKRFKTKTSLYLHKKKNCNTDSDYVVDEHFS